MQRPLSFCSIDCFFSFSSASCYFVTPFVTRLGRVPEELLGEFPCLECVALIGDVIPLEDTAGPVPRDLHDYRLRYARSPKIPDRCSAKIMEQEPEYACGVQHSGYRKPRSS